MNSVETTPFLKATITHQIGENGHPEWILKGLGNNLLGFSDKFI